MSAHTDKEALLDELRERLRARLRALTDSQATSQEGATHAEMRAEDPKDMRSTEASYLARGLAERVAQLRAALVRLEGFAPAPFPEEAAIGIGALVSLEDDLGNEIVHFLVPVAAGEKLGDPASPIVSVSPESPLGQELIGRRVDESFEFELPRGRVEATILAVR